MTTASHRPVQLRKTRIVCISDTHNQTPKLPKGDVLIHAGDLTKQGSYPELRKTVDWLEKTDFEAKIVVAGNHDITLDTPFFEQHGSSWRWPKPQDPEKCKNLFVNSSSITYLEHEAASIYLKARNGPHTCFKVFGSPYSPELRNWAFQYAESEAAAKWDAIPLDSDIVVTHTPPRGHLDVGKSQMAGCEALRMALYRVRPLLSVFGHIHEARGVERVRWNLDAQDGEPLEESIEAWTDPGIGNNKQSLVDLTAKGRRRLRNVSAQTRHSTSSLTTSGPIREQWPQTQPATVDSTSRFEGVNNEAAGKALAGGAIEYRVRDIGFSKPDVEADERRRRSKQESCLINAAFLGAHFGGGPKLLNKPIVIDIDLPVWTELPGRV